MNRRQLFRNALALSAASVVAPAVLADVLPGTGVENAYTAYGVATETYYDTIPLSKLVNVNVALGQRLWPTYEEILASLVATWTDGSVGPVDRALLESVALQMYEQWCSLAVLAAEGEVSA